MRRTNIKSLLLEYEDLSEEQRTELIKGDNNEL